MINRFFFCLGAALFTTACLPAFSAENVFIINDELVITGTRTEKTITDAPVKTELINRQTISENHYQDLSELIEAIPGITKQESVGRVGSSAIIQGLGDKQVLVAIDGVPQVQSSVTGFDLSQIASADIQRVEVIKGGASSLYGSQAIGGVINIITKKPTQKTQYYLDLTQNVYASSKVNNLQSQPNSINASLSGRAATVGYKVSLNRSQRGRFDLDPSTITEDGSEYKKTGGSLALSKKITRKLSTNIQARLNEYKSNFIISEVTPSGEFEKRLNNSDTFSQNYNAGFIYKPLLNTTVSLNGNFSQIDDQLVLNDNPNTAYVESTQSSMHKDYRVELKWDDVFFENNLSSAGIVYNQQSLDQSENKVQEELSARISQVDDKKIESLELFAQNDIVFDQVEVVPGVRYQVDEAYGSHLSPKINIRYSPALFSGTQTTLRSSVGTGYRTPSLRERYYLLDHRSFGGYILTGNKNLSPEKSVSYQLGIEITKSKRASIYVNGFINNVKDLIDVRENTVSLNERIFEYQNYQKVQSRGFEINASWQALRFLRLQQDFTHSKTVDQNTKNMIPFRPMTVARSTITINPFKKFSAHAIYRFQSEEFTNSNNSAISPRFSIIDLKFNYKLFQENQLYIGINNLLDVTRTGELDGIQEGSLDNRPELGRTIYLGVTVRG